MGQLKAIITDFDGTLVNTQEANIQAYATAAKYAGCSFDVAKYKKSFGLRFPEMCDELGIPEDKRTKLKELKKKFYPMFFKRIQINKLLFNFLAESKSKGIKICLASTASKDNLYNVLNYFKIKDFFDYIITGEDVVNGKPDPEVYLKALEKCGCNPEDALIFEDSEVGFKAANAANVKYIGVKI